MARPAPAQAFCLLAGVVLIAAGALGFIANADFAGASDRGSLLGLDVNGWHNVVHLATGLLLLAGAPNATAARIACALFGGAYAVVAALGWIDGGDVLGVIPVDGAANALHTTLAALALLAALAPARTRAPRSSRGLEHIAAAYDASSPKQVFVGIRD